MSYVAEIETENKAATKPKGWFGKATQDTPVAEPADPPQSDKRCSPSTLKLAESDLARSGSSLAAVAADGMFAVDDASAVDPSFAAKPALVIPYTDPHGRPVTYLHNGTSAPYHRVRYLSPPGWPSPKGRKYDQPPGSGTPPYFAPSFDWSDANLRDVGGVVVCEGEKKAGAACAAGFPAIGIGGVDNFSDGAAALHPEIARIAKLVGSVWIVHDSDAATKDRVRGAEDRLAGQLAVAGATPTIVRLPSGECGSKMGVDDYLAAYGSDALRDLMLGTPPVGEEALVTSGEVVTLAELMAGDVAPVPELIPDWLQKGIVTFLAGQGGVHKSRLALQLGLCLNAGVLPPGLGAIQRATIERGPIATLVYVSAEDGVDELRRRAQMIAGQLKLKRPKDSHAVFLPRDGKDCALVVIQEGGKVEFRPFYHELTSLLCSIPGHKLVVLDSAYDFARWTGKTKIEEDAVNWFIKVFLRGICDQCDATLLIPWHPSQAGSEREDVAGWSVAWHNAPRARWALKASKDITDAFELSVTKRSHGRKADPVLLRFHEGALLPAAEIPDDGKAVFTRKAVVAAAIKAAGVGQAFTQQRNPAAWVLTEVSKACGRSVSAKEVKDHLQGAVVDGELIYRAGHGKVRAGYFPPDENAASGPDQHGDGGAP
jgi:hypothetical protein